MSDKIMTETAESVSKTADSPPIAVLLPLLQLILAGSTVLFHLGLRLVLTTVYPLRIIWSIMHALFSPVTIILKLTLDIVLLTPISIISMIALALYPIYVFCAVACIIGATIGLFGHYVSTAILGALSRSKYFIRPPSPPLAALPSGPALRKRKRKSVRLQ